MHSDLSIYDSRSFRYRLRKTMLERGLSTLSIIRIQYSKSNYVSSYSIFQFVFISLYDVCNEWNDMGHITCTNLIIDTLYNQGLFKIVALASYAYSIHGQTTWSLKIYGSTYSAWANITPWHDKQELNVASHCSISSMSACL